MMKCLKMLCQDGMRIYYDIPIPARDGACLMADAYCPLDEGRYPIVMTFGPYGKNQSFQVQTPLPWKRLCKETPEVAQDTTARYLTWETVDPEKWTRAGYIVVRVDSRGSGRTPGKIDPFGWQEAEDYYDCIEWLAVQDLCNGKVGLLGISYFAITQWNVASLNPPHLAAFCPWEGSCDFYREQVRKGGILGGIGGLKGNWWNAMILPGQYGTGVRSYLNPVSGLRAGGEETLPEDELARNRTNNVEDCRSRELFDEWYQKRTPKLENIQAPLLSCGNWGGHNLHLRGNIEGYMRAGSREKWLELHGGTHFTDFYKKEGYELQRRFFDHYLKGEDNGWETQAPVTLRIRHPYERFETRTEECWPPKDTKMVKYYLYPQLHVMSKTPPEEEFQETFAADEGSLTFQTDVFLRETEFTGPVSATFYVSSTTRDADLVLALRLIGPDGEEVTFQGASAPQVPLSMGWLRLSHRKTDPQKSYPGRPWHPHDELQYLNPGEIYQAEVEILPTCIVVPAGFRLALTVQARDWERSANWQNDLWDKRPELYAGQTTLYCGKDKPSYLYLPERFQPDLQTLPKK